jgi:HSP20 family protein
MALIHWEPSQEVGALQREINRLFDNFMAPLTRQEQGWAFIPSVEIDETPETVILSLEIPGMKKDDINVEVATDSVAISGERQSKSETKENGTVRSEFRYGKFHRLIPLPMHVDNQGVEAQYREGILKLTLPKAEEERRKTVKVEVD